MATPPFDIDQSKPADVGIVSQHPADERSMRDIVESWLLIDHDTDGEHDKVTLPERADPTLSANKGFTYSKDVGGKTELHYMDSAGDVTQLTSAGGLLSVPAGTKMLFQQTAAPTGWTKDTTHNNKALRVVSGAASSGGATNFTTVFGTPKTTGSHVLVTAETPIHTHGLGTLAIVSAGGHVHTITGMKLDDASGGVTPEMLDDASLTPTVTSDSGGANTAGAHVHTFSGALANTGSGSGHDHTLSLDLQYVDLIIATKD